MRTIIAAVTLTALVTAPLASASDADGARLPAAAKERAQTVISKALNWLESQQKENGSWTNENYPAMTALGLWAFARSNHPRKATVCRKAASFVATYIQEDGGIYKKPGLGLRSGGLSTYNTAICMTALHAYDPRRFLPVVLKAREFVADSQLVGDSPGTGGFGYERPKENRGLLDFRNRWASRPDLSNTGWALMAMRATQGAEDMREGSERVDVNWDAALAYLAALQNQDAKDENGYGGFGYEKGGARGGTKTDRSGKVALRGFGSMTYAGIESMIYARVTPTDPRVKSAVAWAGRHWSVDENPGMGTKGLFYYYTIMGKALGQLGAEALTGADGEVILWRNDLTEKLAREQDANGSWVNSNNQFWEGDAVLVTSYSILALQFVVAE